MRSFITRHQAPVLLIAGLAVIAAVSPLSSHEALQVTLTEMLIRVLVVVGLYVFIGNSGIISFGQIGFMCIGAYAAAWATAEPALKQIMLGRACPTSCRRTSIRSWSRWPARCCCRPRWRCCSAWRSCGCPASRLRSQPSRS